MSKDKQTQSRRRSNGEVFIRALMSYKPVQYRNVTYRLIKAGDPIACITDVYEADYDVLTFLHGEYVVPWDVSFNDIMQMCASMTEEERMGIVGSHVLMTMNART